MDYSGFSRINGSEYSSESEVLMLLMGFKIFLVVPLGKKEIIADYSNNLRKYEHHSMHNDKRTWPWPPAIRNYVTPQNNDNSDNSYES